MTVDDIIDDLLLREGEGHAPWLAPGDAGGRTSWGISERSHPEAWKGGPPSRAVAREIYLRDYVQPFDPLIAKIDPRIRVALIDDGVMSGVGSAIKRFQHVLNVPMDGVIGPRTIQAAARWAGPDLLKAYVIERAVRITRLVQFRVTNLPFLTGWITRILGFLP